MRISSFAAALIALFSPVAYAQVDVELFPELTIVPNREEYERLAPVLLTVEITNPTDSTRVYNHPYPLAGLEYDLVGPSGEVLPMYRLYWDLMVNGAVELGPGESRSFTFDLLRFFPASVTPGPYALSIVDGAGGVLATASYSIRDPGPSPSLDALAEAARGVWDFDWWTLTSTVDADVELARLSADPLLPAYGRELASYLYALAADVDGIVGGDQSRFAEARSRYGSFIAEYPASAYVGPARDGYSSVDAEDVVDPFSSLLGAVVISGLDVDASFSGTSMSVSGLPVTLSGTDDIESTPVHGIAVETEVGRSSVLAALGTNQIDRVTGQGEIPDVAVGAAPFDLAAWTDGLVTRAAVTLDSRPTGPIGTAEAPVVAYAPSGARLSGGFSGIGILVVDGTFEMRGDAEWLGLVVVRGSSDQQADPTLSGNPRILGALLVLPGSGAGTAALRLSGQVSVLYSPEALALASAAAEQ